MTIPRLTIVKVQTALGERLLLADHLGHVLPGQERLTIRQDGEDLVHVEATFTLQSTG